MDVRAFIHEIYESVVGTIKEPAQKSAQKGPKLKTTIEVKTEKPTDKFEGGNTYGEVKKVNNNDEKSIGAVKTELTAVCRKYNIDDQKLDKYLYAIVGTKAEFDKLSENARKSLLQYVIESVNRVGEKAPENVDKLEAVVTDAAFMYKAITRNGDGTYSSLDSLTPEQMAERRKDFEGFLKNKYETEKQKLSKLGEKEKAAAIKKLKDAQAAMRHFTFSHISKKVKAESALELMPVLAAKDLGKGAEEFLASLPEEKRKEIAIKYHKYEHFTECVKAAQARGEDITSEEVLASFEKYNTEFVSWKDSNASIDYIFKSTSARENGDLPEAVYKAVAKGIGIGAYANHVMDSVQKESILKCWIHNNAGFLTDEEFIEIEKAALSYIQEYQSSNPDVKCDKVRTIDVLAKEILNKPLDTQSKKAPSSEINASKSVSTACTGKGATRPIISQTSPITTHNDKKTEEQQPNNYNIIDAVEKLVMSGTSVKDICEKVGKKAVPYLLSNPICCAELLSDNGLIKKYKKDIEQYVNDNLINIEKKRQFVIAHQKTLHIVLNCLNNDDEKKKFAKLMNREICYTDYVANFGDALKDEIVERHFV